MLADGAKKLVVALVVCAGCKNPTPAPSPPTSEEPPPPPAPSDAPVAPAGYGTMPAIDGGQLGGTPFEDAKAYAANGQFWMARLVLEPKALGDRGTPTEVDLLGGVCNKLNDKACVASCEKKVGRKLRDVPLGTPDRKGAKSESVPQEPTEPDNDLTRARNSVLRGDNAGARKLLEPKVLGGHASREEIRVLRAACEREADRMCVALCDTKLK